MLDAEVDIYGNWDKLPQILQDRGMSEIILETWIRPLRVFDVSDDRVRFLFIPERVNGEEYIKKNGYDKEIESAFREILHNPNLKVQIDSRENFIKEDDKDADREREVRRIASDMYTFDDFIVGFPNKVAYMVCRQVAENPLDVSVNPIYIYGSTGIGKTHLLRSVQTYIEKNHPNVKSMYITTEEFTNRFIFALKEKSLREFKDKCREVDVFIIDDMNYLADREKTRDLFLHTIEDLRMNGKQIIMSADRRPDEFQHSDDMEKFIQVLKWGVTLELLPLDRNTARELLKKYASDRGIESDMTDEIYDYILENIHNSPRVYQGAVNRLALYRKKFGVELDFDIVVEALSCLVAESKVDITPQMIKKTVADYFGITVDDLSSNSRWKQYAYPRMISMYLFRVHTDMGLNTIGMWHGGKQYSTVYNAIKNVETLKKNDIKTSRDINNITEDLMDIY